MSLIEAAASDDHLAALRALRDRLAREIDACESARDVAALAARLADVLVKIDAVPKPEQKGSALDELTKRRADRGAATASVEAAGRKA